MDEAEWLTSCDPDAMLSHLKGDGSDRKLRLFTCASVRRIWKLVTSERSRRAVDIMERYADGQATEDERRDAEIESDDVYDVPCDAVAIAAHMLTNQDARYATVASVYAAGAMADVYGQKECDDETAQQLLLLRDIFANPFRPITLDPSCRSSGVVALAQTIYDQRAFERMPELADALQTAGCNDAQVLAHCRGSGPHVRGCWVVDLVLGKH